MSYLDFVVGFFVAVVVVVVVVVLADLSKTEPQFLQIFLPLNSLKSVPLQKEQTSLLATVDVVADKGLDVVVDVVDVVSGFLFFVPQSLQM